MKNTINHIRFILILLTPSICFANDIEKIEVQMKFSAVYVDREDLLDSIQGTLTFSKSMIGLITPDNLEFYRIDSVFRSTKGISFYTSQYKNSSKSYEGKNIFTVLVDKLNIVYWYDKEVDVYIQLIIDSNWTSSFPFIRDYFIVEGKKGDE